MIAGKVTRLGLALATAFWIVDAMMHASLMNAGMRAFPVLLAIILGTYAQRSITERQRVEAELRKSKERTCLTIERPTASSSLWMPAGASRAGTPGPRPSPAGPARRRWAGNSPI